MSPPPPTSASRLVFPAKQQVQLETFHLPPLQDGEILVRTQFSLMSTGTENIVFNRLFDPGTHWDQWVAYPFYPGYSAVGIVEESKASAFKPGDTGRPASQKLSSDVITRGITIVGAHDGHNTAEWNGASISRVFFSLASTGRFPLEGLNTHHFQPGDCANAYETANRDRTKTMGIVFDWSHES